MDEITKFIGQVGFPIFVCCVLLWDKIKSQGKMDATLSEVGANLAAATSQLADLLTLLKKKNGGSQ